MADRTKLSQMWLASRRILAAAAVVLIIVAAGLYWAIRDQIEYPRTWLEFEARPRPTCYQGLPRREVMHWQLWSGGPSLRVFEERQIRLRR